MTAPTRRARRAPQGWPCYADGPHALKGEEELTLQHKHIVKSVNFSPNGGKLLATASNDKLLR